MRDAVWLQSSRRRPEAQGRLPGSGRLPRLVRTGRLRIRERLPIVDVATVRGQTRTCRVRPCEGSAWARIRPEPLAEVTPAGGIVSASCCLRMATSFEPTSASGRGVPLAGWVRRARSQPVTSQVRSSRSVAPRGALLRKRNRRPSGQPPACGTVPRFLRCPSPPTVVWQTGFRPRSGAGIRVQSRRLQPSTLVRISCRTGFRSAPCGH